MNLTALKKRGLPFLQEILRVFKDAFPLALTEHILEHLRGLTIEGVGIEKTIVEQALQDLSELQKLATRKKSKISLDEASSCFTVLNTYMPELELRNFDLLFLPAVIRTTLEFANSSTDTPELKVWLNRRAAQDFKRLWLALVGMRLNPFSLRFPTEIANFEEQFSLLLSSLVGRRGIVRVEGGAGVGKTAFLRKACRTLLSHQIEQRPIVTTYLENKRGNAKQFLTDIYAGFFNQYLMEAPALREALTFSLPFDEEATKISWMAAHEEVIRDNIFLPSHILEALFDSTKVKANHIFNRIVSFTQANDLALVILLDDMDGKVRSGLSSTQVNFLLSIQDECTPCFIIASVRPRGRIARPIFDRSTGEIRIEGLSETEIQSMIRMFFGDPRTSFMSNGRTQDGNALVSRDQLQQLLFANAMRQILSESYIETRSDGSLFRPRSVVGICERVLEQVSSDTLDIRAFPKQADVFEAVKAIVKLST